MQINYFEFFCKKSIRIVILFFNKASYLERNNAKPPKILFMGFVQFFRKKKLLLQHKFFDYFQCVGVQGFNPHLAALYAHNHQGVLGGKNFEIL